MATRILYGKYPSPLPATSSTTLLPNKGLSTSQKRPHEELTRLEDENNRRMQDEVKRMLMEEDPEEIAEYLVVETNRKIE